MSFKDSVEVAPLQEAFRRSGLTPSEVARRMDYWCTKGSGRPHVDDTRFMRLIGLREYAPATKSHRPKTHVRYDIALKICDALHVDPVELGL